MALVILKDRYVLQKISRSGRLADIYSALDTASNDRVAVKLFKKGLPEEPVIREAFRRESQRLIHLRHPTLIGMLDYGEDGPDGRPFLVLEWGGEPLDVWFQGDFPYRDWGEFYDSVGRPLLEGIAYAHSRETVHRELKPSDFLVGEDGKIRLADFGVSRFPEFLDVSLDIGAFIKANEPFAPSNGYDPAYAYATDVWGYAAICLHLLTKGALKTWEQIPGVIATFPASEDVRAALMDALRDNAAERPADAQLLLDRLNLAHRRSKPAGSRLVCTLDLKRSAMEKYQREFGPATPREIETVLLAELNNAPAAWEPFSKFDPAVGRRVSEAGTYYLMGQSLSLIAAIDRETGAHFCVTSISRPHSEATFDQMRSRAWTYDIEYRVGRSLIGQRDRDNVEFIANSVAAHSEKAGERMILQEEERLFRSWNDLLQVRLDHGREQKFYDYRGVDQDGNRITFTAETHVDPQIVEETWGVHGHRIFGVVEEVGENSITLYLDEADGHNVPENGRLVIDARATERQLKIQLEALNTMRYPKTPRQEVLRKCILRPTEIDTPAGGVEISRWFSSRLDDNKKKIIQSALDARDLYLVEGPPGTGKTTFIAELILQYLEQNPNKRVLLTSQTHIAVDNAIERVAQFKPELKITRVGRREAKVAESAHQYLLGNRIIEWRKRVYGEATRFLKDRAVQEGFNPAEIQMGLDAGLLVQARQELARSERTEIDCEKELTEIRNELAAKTSEGNPVTDGERAAFLREEERRLEEDLSRSRQGRKDRSAVARKLGEGFKKLYPDYAELVTKSVAEITEWQDALIGDSPAAQRFRALFQLNSEWMQRFTRDEDCEEAILLDSDLIAGTCIGVANCDTEDEGYGLCILDEASKAAFPEALVPMVRSEKWILVGDQRQLSPFMDAMLRDRDLLTSKGIDREVVAETLLGRLARLEVPATNRAMLDHQHRMVPAIGSLVSHIFYQRLLHSVGGQSIPRALTQVAQKPVVWFSTSRIPEHGEERHPSNPSFINSCEGRVIRKLLDRLDLYHQHQPKGSTEGPLKVAVLTGYAGQKAHLEIVLGAGNRASLETECHTVDAYQGREADVVLLSITRSNKQYKAGFLAERQRINVALSRARYGLWIVGDADFCSSLGAASPLSEVLDYIASHPADCGLVDMEDKKS